MADKIIRPDGTVLSPINTADQFEISQEMIDRVMANIDIRPQLNLPDYSSQLAGINEAIEAGKEDMIRRQAEANAEAYAKALRTAPFLFDEIAGALSSLCGNPTYNSKSLEDPMNDYVRDILGHGLQVRDQTRQGISGNSRSAEKGQAGELDIQIRNNGRPIGIYEGLRLKDVNSTESVVRGILGISDRSGKG